MLWLVLGFYNELYKGFFFFYGKTNIFVEHAGVNRAVFFTFTLLTALSLYFLIALAYKK